VFELNGYSKLVWAPWQNGPRQNKLNNRHNIKTDTNQIHYTAKITSILMFIEINDMSKRLNCRLGTANNDQ